MPSNHDLSSAPATAADGEARDAAAAHASRTQGGAHGVVHALEGNIDVHASGCPSWRVHELEEALNAGRGVLRPSTIEAVREEHHEAGLAHPLGLRAREELVDDDLGAVGEVAELSLPHGKHAGGLERVAVLEAEDAEL